MSKKRRKIQTDKVVHFLQVFEDSNSCTWFVMPLYLEQSAYAFLRRYPECPTREMLCIVKLALQALRELHAEGASHGKLTMRNVLLVEQDGRVSVKLTNKASHIINTLIYRNITGANDTFSPTRFAKALKDYDVSLDPSLPPPESEEDESEISSSDTGTLSLGSAGTVLSLTDVVKKEERAKSATSKSGHGSVSLSGSSGANSTTARPRNSQADDVDPALQWTKIAKAEDIMAALKMLARIYELQKKRLKEARSSAKVLNEELGDWEDLLPHITSIDLSKSASDGVVLRTDKLPTLEELLRHKVFLSLDAERELANFLRKKRFIDQVSRSSGSSNSSNLLDRSRDGGKDVAMAAPLRTVVGWEQSAPFFSSPVNAQSSGRAMSPPNTPDIEEPPTPPEELLFVTSSKRERCLGKIEDAARKASARAPTSGAGSRRNRSSPRISGDRKAVSHLMQTNVLVNADQRKAPRALTTLFSSSPSAAPEEYNADWVCAFTVFFYNKTWLLWNATGCHCTTFEAGTGKWLWRSAKTGVIQNLSAPLYVRYLMQGYLGVLPPYWRLSSRAPFLQYLRFVSSHELAQQQDFI